MRLSSPFLRFLAALVASAGIASTGCVFTDGNGGGDESTPVNLDPPPAPIQQMTIDADATLQAKGGEGVGVFVEYATGGSWHVFTACDVNQPTNPDHQTCAFDVFAKTLTTGSRLSNAQGENLQSSDVVSLGGDGTVHLSTETDTGLNGMTFSSDPGAIVELDVYLDNSEDPHYIYWVGDGVLHQGSPSDPLDLAPSEKPTSAGAPGK